MALQVVSDRPDRPVLRVMQAKDLGLFVVGDPRHGSRAKQPAVVEFHYERVVGRGAIAFVGESIHLGWFVR